MLLNTFTENRQLEKQVQQHNQDQSQGASIVGEVLSGLGSIITPNNYLNDYELTVTDEEERKRKLKKKRRYGRQQ